MPLSGLKRVLRLAASLKVAIPLLVLLIAATVIGSLFPQPDLFRSTWYLGLLGVLGLSLALITVIHIPRILRRKGRNALIGVITTHAGILVLIAAAMVGGTQASRWQFRAIEGEMTVVPGMPFVVELVSLAVEDYAPDAFPGMNLERLPRKRQDSRVRLHRGGGQVAEFTTSPGNPGRFEGYTLLPSVSGLGWTFRLVLRDGFGRERTELFAPWNPPLLSIGGQQFMVHARGGEEARAVEVFALEQGEPALLGEIAQGSPLQVGDTQLRLEGFARYTSMKLYNRPHTPLLVIGVALMMAGLIWHFYFRYRD